MRPEEPRRARERHLRRYGPPRGSSTWIYWTVAVIGLLVFALLMRAVLEKTRWTAPDAATFVADPASAAVAAGA